MWSTEVFKDITKNFTFIQKVWDFFDTSKSMDTYDGGNDFVFST